jgi:diadenosine tetraphosphatase ApaH/serine/threonine PP2A family protein phosphatase
MRIAVISDIHANLHALEAVLAEVDAAGFAAVWCLGDLVGYGPRPNECARLVRARAELCLAGNHDLLAIDAPGGPHESEFNPVAAAALRWTRAALDEETRAYLAELASTARRGELGLYHGSPRDPVWEYVLDAESALLSLLAAPERVVLVGHTHTPLRVSLAGRTLTGGVAQPDDEVDLTEGRHLLNPGSVGQPRDGDPRASWLAIDLTAMRATFRRTAYAVARTQEEIRERGLPEVLAERLAHGA